jgi:integrase
MPIPELMTWVASQRRWAKQYGGKRYYVSARKLGTAETKEASLLAANQWWRDKQAEVDYAMKANTAKQMRIPQPMEDIASAALGAPPDAFADVRRLLETALLREEKQRPKGKPAVPGNDEITIDAPDPDEGGQVRRREVMGLLEQLLFGADAKIPEETAAQLPPARVQQIESAVKELKGESTAPPERTVGAKVDRWIGTYRAMASIGVIEASRLRNLRIVISKFSAFLGETSSVDAIDSDRLEGFYLFCLSKIAEKGWSVTYAKQVFSAAKSFVRWLAEGGEFTPPANLLSKRFRFGSTSKAIRTWTVEECQRVISEASPRLRLMLLLMLNCGMTQIDVSDLLDAEVDWTAGRITRKRSKTSDIESTPTVNYKLWPATFALLKQYRSGADRVLVTANGNPLVLKRIVDGKPTGSDVVATCFARFKARIGFKKSMKQLRKTASTMLDSHETYARFSTLFLGHAPTSMKDKHYSDPPQNRFDEAVLWLGQQFGLAD